MTLSAKNSVRTWESAWESIQCWHTSVYMGKPNVNILNSSCFPLLLFIPLLLKFQRTTWSARKVRILQTISLNQFRKFVFPVESVWAVRTSTVKYATVSSFHFWYIFFHVNIIQNKGDNIALQCWTRFYKGPWTLKKLLFYHTEYIL